MKSLLDPFSIANDIQMTRTQHKGSFLIVEGSGSDLLLYKKFVKPKFCQIIPAHSKVSLIEVARLLIQSKFSGFAAIVDSDFDKLLQEKLYGEDNHIYTTDTHDLETLMLQSSALEDILVEYGSEEKIKKIHAATEKSVVDLLLDAGKHIGCLRLISLKKQYNFSFDRLDYKNFINKDSLEIDRKALVKEVKNKSSRHDLSERIIFDEMSEVENAKHDILHLCCGHDLVKILSLGLTKAIGSEDSKNVTPEAIERSLRLAYKFNDFKKTVTYQSLKKWESNNSPFSIFSD
jgi:hypothetical protein